MATVRLKGFLASPSGASSAFTKAKKQASLILEKSKDAKGNVRPEGYEQAISLMSQFVFEDGNVGIDAQRLVAGYENDLQIYKTKQAKLSTSLGQLKLDEQEIYFVDATSARSDIMQNIPDMIGSIADSLTTHMAQVENAIEAAYQNNESTSELEEYARGLSSRYREVTSLYNDYITGELSQGQMLDRFGVFVDADQEDGSINRIGVVPVDNMPPGVSSGSFKRLDSSVNYNGSMIPVYSSFSTNDLGEVTSRIGSKVWNGMGNSTLTFDKKMSSEKGFKNEPGSFDFMSAPIASSPIRNGKFTKSVVGFDDEGKPVEQLFYADDKGSLWKIKDKSIFEGDPLMKDKINKATLLSPSYAKSLMQSSDIKEMSIDTLQNIKPENPTNAIDFVSGTFSSPLLQSVRSRTTPQASAPQEPQRQSFFENKNRPNKPEEAKGEVGFAEKAKSFFSGMVGRNNV